MSLVSKLMQEIDEVHQTLHVNPLQLKTKEGTLTKEEYGQQLWQLYIIHNYLEEMHDDVSFWYFQGNENGKNFATIMTQDQYHEKDAYLDANFLGVENLERLRSTDRFMDYLSRVPNDVLLAPVFVLEGALAGGARAIRGYLEPRFGENTRYFSGSKNFKAFTQRMDASDLELEPLVIVATQTFKHIDNIYKEVVGIKPEHL